MISFKSSHRMSRLADFGQKSYFCSLNLYFCKKINFIDPKLFFMPVNWILVTFCFKCIFYQNTEENIVKLSKCIKIKQNFRKIWFLSQHLFLWIRFYSFRRKNIFWYFRKFSKFLTSRNFCRALILALKISVKNNAKDFQ